MVLASVVWSHIFTVIVLKLFLSCFQAEDKADVLNKELSEVVSLLFPGRGQGGRSEQGVVGDQEPTNGGGGREEAVGVGGQPG